MTLATRQIALSAVLGALGIVVWMVACSDGTGTQSSALTRGTAVLLAERSITIDKGANVVGGDVVVRQIEPWQLADGGVSTAAKNPDAGVASPPQLVVGKNANVGVASDCSSHGSTVSAASALLDKDSCVGNLQTNALSTKGKPGLLSQTDFPAAMLQPLPLAIPPLAVGVNVSVPPKTTQSLSAGNYGNVVVGKKSTLELAPGSYTFQNFELDED